MKVSNYNKFIILQASLGVFFRKHFRAKERAKISILYDSFHKFDKKRYLLFFFFSFCYVKDRFILFFIESLDSFFVF